MCRNGQGIHHSLPVFFSADAIPSWARGKMLPLPPNKHPDRYNWKQVTESEPNQTLHAQGISMYIRVKMADEGFITA